MPTTKESPPALATEISTEERMSAPSSSLPAEAVQALHHFLGCIDHHALHAGLVHAGVMSA